MIAALGVEACTAIRALIIAVLILVDGHFLLAYSAKNSLGIKFIFVPYFSFMSGGFFMAIKAGIVSITAFKLNGNNIKRGMIMCAACLPINCFSFYYNHCVSFNLPLIVEGVSPLFFLHQCRYRDALPMFAQQYFALL